MRQEQSHTKPLIGVQQCCTTTAADTAWHRQPHIDRTHLMIGQTASVPFGGRVLALNRAAVDRQHGDLVLIFPS